MQHNIPKLLFTTRALLANINIYGEETEKYKELIIISVRKNLL